MIKIPHWISSVAYLRRLHLVKTIGTYETFLEQSNRTINDNHPIKSGFSFNLGVDSYGIMLDNQEMQSKVLIKR